MDEGIDFTTYSVQETQAIVNSLARHVTKPGQQQQTDDSEKTENERLADTLLKHVGQKQIKETTQWQKQSTETSSSKRRQRQSKQGMQRQNVDQDNLDIKIWQCNI